MQKWHRDRTSKWILPITSHCSTQSTGINSCRNMNQSADHFRFLVPDLKRLSTETFSVEAILKSSKSRIPRTCASICDKVPRLISSPCNWHRAASCSCVSSNSYRRCRICGPTTFAGFLILAIARKVELDRNQNYGLDCYAILAQNFSSEQDQ